MGGQSKGGKHHLPQPKRVTQRGNQQQGGTNYPADHHQANNPFAGASTSLPSPPPPDAALPVPPPSNNPFAAVVGRLPSTAGHTHYEAFSNSANAAASSSPSAHSVKIGWGDVGAQQVASASSSSGVSLRPLPRAAGGEMKQRAPDTGVFVMESELDGDGEFGVTADGQHQEILEPEARAAPENNAPPLKMNKRGRGHLSAVQFSDFQMEHKSAASSSSSKAPAKAAAPRFVSEVIDLEEENGEAEQAEQENGGDGYMNEDEYDDGTTYVKLTEPNFAAFSKQQLEQFVYRKLDEMIQLGSEEAPTYEFPHTLTNVQRKTIHVIAQNVYYRDFIQHESFGTRDVDRFLVMWYGARQDRAKKIWALHERYGATGRVEKKWGQNNQNAAGAASSSTLVPVGASAKGENNKLSAAAKKRAASVNAKLKDHLANKDAVVQLSTTNANDVDNRRKPFETLAGGMKLVKEKKDEKKNRLPVAVASASEAEQIWRNQHRAMRNEIYSNIAGQQNTKPSEVLNINAADQALGGSAAAGAPQDESFTAEEMRARVGERMEAVTEDYVGTEGNPELGAAGAAVSASDVSAGGNINPMGPIARKHSLAEAAVFLSRDANMEITHAADLDLDDDDGNLDVYCFPNLTEQSFAKVLAYYNFSYVEEYKREEARVAYARSQNPGGNYWQTNKGAQQQLSEQDLLQLKQTVTSVFERFIEVHGFLTVAHIQGQLDNLAWSRQMQPYAVLNLPHVGGFLKGLLQISFVIDSTCQIAFGCAPILTLWDLQQAIARNPAIQSQESLKALGQLEYHPLVRRNFQLNLMSTIQGEGATSSNSNKGSKGGGKGPGAAGVGTKRNVFPELSTERLIGYIVATIPADNWDEHQGNDWTIETGLKKVATLFKKTNYLDLGVFVQRQGLVRTIMRRIKKKVDREQGVLTEAVENKQWKLAKLDRSFVKENQLVAAGIHSRQEIVHISNLMKWENVFRGFEKCGSYGLRLEFCEALCARDVGLDFRRSFKGLYNAVAELRTAIEKGEALSAQKFDALKKLIAARKEADLDEILDRFVKHSLSPLLFLSLANVIPLTKAAAKKKSDFDTVWNKNALQRADNLRKLFVSQDLKRRIVKVLDAFPTKSVDLMEVLSNCEQVYLQFLRCASNSDAPVSVLEYIMHAAPLQVVVTEEPLVTEMKTLREILEGKIEELAAAGGDASKLSRGAGSGSAGAIVSSSSNVIPGANPNAGAGPSGALGGPGAQQVVPSMTVSKAAGLLSKAAGARTSGMAGSLPSAASTPGERTGPPGEMAAGAGVSETAYAEHLLQVLAERIGALSHPPKRVLLSDFLEWLGECETLLTDQYGREAIREHSILELLGSHEKYGYRLADLLFEKNCLVAGPKQLVNSISSDHLSEGGEQGASVGLAAISRTERKFWQHVALLWAAERIERSLPIVGDGAAGEDSDKRDDFLRLRWALRTHFAGRADVSVAAVDALATSSVPDAKDLSRFAGSESAQLQEARSNIAQNCVPRLALMTNANVAGDDLEVAEDENDTAENKLAAESEALRRVHTTPLMMSIDAANPDWSAKFLPYLGSVAQFCGSLLNDDATKNAATTASSSTKALRDKAAECLRTEFLEVRSGVFLRIGNFADAAQNSSDELRRCLFESDDLRSAVAVVMRRFVQENQNRTSALGKASESEQAGAAFSAASSTYESEVAEYYSSAQSSGSSSASGHKSAEKLALAFARLLPAEVLTFTAVGDVFLRPYVQLRRPRTLLLAETAGDVDGRLLVLQLGTRFGITDWQVPSETNRQSWLASRGATAPILSQHIAGAPPTKKRRLEQAADETVDPKPASHAAEAKPESEQSASAKGIVKAADVEATTGGNLAQQELVNPGTTGEEEEGADSNEVLCTEIARVKGVPLQDVDPDSRYWLREPADERIRSLQKTLQGAVSRLAADLYSGESHFILEMLQNADDCAFSPHVTPALCITVSDQLPLTRWTSFDTKTTKAVLVAEHCEDGFRAKDVRALCDIAQSTKTNKKFIGHKGVGFKSVFKVTKTPIIHSGRYSFHFDSSALNGLGYLVPFPLPRLASNLSADVLASSSTTGTATTGATNFGTRIVLPLVDSLSAVQLVGRLSEDLQPRLLLFLRKLQRLVLAHEGYFKVRMQKSVLFEDATSSILVLETNSAAGAAQPSPSSVNKETWFVHTETLVSPTDRGNADAELKIAIPVPDVSEFLNLSAAGAGVPLEAAVIKEAQQVFAWLPTRSYGFRFVIQADFAVATSREALTSTDGYNQFLRDHVPAAFCKAVKQYIEHVGRSFYDLVVQVGDDAFLSLQSPVSEQEPGEQVVPKTNVHANRIQVLHLMLAQLYHVMPLPGDGLEFFQRTPRAILAALESVDFLFVRRHAGGGASSSSSPRALLSPSSTATTAFVTPKKTLRAKLPPFVSAGARKAFAALLEGRETELPSPRHNHDSSRSLQDGSSPARGGVADLDHQVIKTLEPLVNECGFFFLVSDALVPQPLAQALHLKSFGAEVATTCLQRLEARLTALNVSEGGGSSTSAAPPDEAAAGAAEDGKPASPGPRTPRTSTAHLQQEREQAELLHRALLLIVAFDEKPDISLLKSLKILPITESRSGYRYASIHEQEQAGKSVYDAEFLVALDNVRVLEPGFRDFVSQEPRVAVLLQRLGVQKLDSQNFCEQHVMPVVLDGEKPPPTEKLLACTLYLKRLLYPVAVGMGNGNAGKLTGGKAAPKAAGKTSDAGKNKKAAATRTEVSVVQRAMPANKRADLVKRLCDGSPWVMSREETTGAQQVVRLRSAHASQTSDIARPNEETTSGDVCVHLAPLLPELKRLASEQSKDVAPQFSSAGEQFTWHQIELEPYCEHEKAHNTAGASSRNTSSWAQFWVELGVWPSFSIDRKKSADGTSADFDFVARALRRTLASEKEKMSAAQAATQQAAANKNPSAPSETRKMWQRVVDMYFLTQFGGGGTGSKSSWSAEVSKTAGAAGGPSSLAAAAPKSAGAIGFGDVEEQSDVTTCGAYYADVEKFGAFHDQLRAESWLLTLTGEHLRTAADAWLPPQSDHRIGPHRSTDPRMIMPPATAAEQGKDALLMGDKSIALERPHILHPHAHHLAAAWPCLNLLKKPSAEHLVRVIARLRDGAGSGEKKKLDAQLCVRDTTYLYARLAQCLKEEHISPSTTTAMATRMTVTATASSIPDTVEHFLLHTPWVWVPHHPKLLNKARFAFGKSGEGKKMSGRFYKLSELCLYDDAKLLDSYVHYVSDIACDIARRTTRKRCVSYYYWSPKTPLPRKEKQNYHPTEEQVRVGNLFTEWGVAESLAWEDYLKVLGSIGEEMSGEGVTDSTTALAVPQPPRHEVDAFAEVGTRKVVEAEDALEVVERIIEHLYASVRRELQDICDEERREAEVDLGDLRGTSTAPADATTEQEQLQAALNALNEGKLSKMSDAVLAAARKHSKVLQDFLLATSNGGGIKFAATMSGTWRVLPRFALGTGDGDSTSSATVGRKLFLPSAPYWTNVKGKHTRPQEKFGFRYDVLEPFVLQVAEQNTMRELTLAAWRLLGVPEFRPQLEKLTLPDHTASRSGDDGGSLVNEHATSSTTPGSTQRARHSNKNLLWDGVTLPQRLLTDYETLLAHNARENTHLLDDTRYSRKVSLQTVVFDLRTTKRKIYHTDFSSLAGSERQKLRKECLSVVQMNADMVYTRVALVELVRLSLDLFEHVLREEEEKSALEKGTKAKLVALGKRFWREMQTFMAYSLEAGAAGGENPRTGGGTGTAATLSTNWNSAQSRAKITRNRLISLGGEGSPDGDKVAQDHHSAVSIYTSSVEEFYTSPASSFGPLQEYCSSSSGAATPTDFVSLYDNNGSASPEPTLVFEKEPFVGLAHRRGDNSSGIDCVFPLKGGQRTAAPSAGGSRNWKVQAATRTFWATDAVSQPDVVASQVFLLILKTLEADEALCERFWHYFCTRCFEPVAGVVGSALVQSVTALSPETEAMLLGGTGIITGSGWSVGTGVEDRPQDLPQNLLLSSDSLSSVLEEVESLSARIEKFVREGLRESAELQAALGAAFQHAADVSRKAAGEGDELAEAMHVEDQAEELGDGGEDEDDGGGENEDEDEDEQPLPKLPRELVKYLDRSPSPSAKETRRERGSSTNIAYLRQLVDDAQANEREHAEAMERERAEAARAAEEARQKRAALLRSVEASAGAAGSQGPLAHEKDSSAASGIDLSDIVTAKKEHDKELREQLKKARERGVQDDAVVVLEDDDEDPGSATGPPLKLQKVSATGGALSRLADDVNTNRQQHLDRVRAAQREKGAGDKSVSAAVSQRVQKADLLGVPGMTAPAPPAGAGPRDTAENKANNTAAAGASTSSADGGAAPSLSAVDVPNGVSDFKKLLQNKDKDFMFRIKHGPRQEQASDPVNAEVRHEAASGHDPETARRRQQVLQKMKQSANREQQNDPALVNEIGELGERQARQALMKMGFAVLWLNEFDETGMPFDFIIRKGRNEDLGVERALGDTSKYFSELLSVSKGEKQLNESRLQALFLAKSSGGDGEQEHQLEGLNVNQYILVEVKASIHKQREYFEVSLQELVAAWRFSERYWILRISNVAAEIAEVRFIKNVPLALQQGDCKLFMMG